MNRHDTSKSGLFLIELILAIFFFIIAMAVCLQLFVKAHTLSQDTISMNHAVLWTQNLAELFLGNDGDFSAVKQAYSESDCANTFQYDSDTCILLLFDGKWNPTSDAGDVRYYVLALASRDEDYSYEDIYIASGVPSDSSTPVDTSTIHHQRIRKYISGEH